jgi:hypothetical protein
MGLAIKIIKEVRNIKTVNKFTKRLFINFLMINHNLVTVFNPKTLFIIVYNLSIIPSIIPDKNLIQDIILYINSNKVYFPKRILHTGVERQKANLFTYHQINPNRKKPMKSIQTLIKAKIA